MPTPGQTEQEYLTKITADGEKYFTLDQSRNQDVTYTTDKISATIVLLRCLLTPLHYVPLIQIFYLNIIFVETMVEKPMMLYSLTTSFISS